MAKYRYRGVSSEGQHQFGEVEAPDETAALAALREKSIMPLEIEAIRESATVEDFFARVRKIPPDVIVVFTRQFATMIESGVTVLNALAMLEEQADNVRFREALRGVVEDVETGIPLSDAMEGQPEVFSEVYCAMVKAGESSGNLAETLRQLAIALERDYRLRRQVKSAMRYPIIISAVAAIVVVLLLIFVVPTFLGLFADMGGELPLPTRIVVNLSEILLPPDGQLIPVIPLLYFAGIAAGVFVGSTLIRRFSVRARTGWLVGAAAAVLIAFIVTAIQFQPSWLLSGWLAKIPGWIDFAVFAYTYQLPSSFIYVGTFVATLGRMLMLGLLLYVIRELWRRWRATPDGRYRWDRFKLNAPMRIGPLVQKVAVARWTRTLAVLLESGVPILTAFDIVKKTTNNVLIEEATDLARERMAAGSTIAEPIAQSNVFPVMVPKMIRAGERSGALDALLGKVAEYFEDEVEISMKGIASIVEPIMIIVVGIVVGSVIVSLYLPMFKIYDLVGEQGLLLPPAWLAVRHLKARVSARRGAGNGSE